MNLRASSIYFFCFNIIGLNEENALLITFNVGISSVSAVINEVNQLLSVNYFTFQRNNIFYEQLVEIIMKSLNDKIQTTGIFCMLKYPYI